MNKTEKLQKKIQILETRISLYKCALKEIQISLKDERPREETLRLVSFWMGDIKDEGSAGD